MLLSPSHAAPFPPLTLYRRSSRRHRRSIIAGTPWRHHQACCLGRSCRRAPSPSATRPSSPPLSGLPPHAGRDRTPLASAKPCASPLLRPLNHRRHHRLVRRPYAGRDLHEIDGLRHQSLPRKASQRGPLPLSRRRCPVPVVPPVIYLPQPQNLNVWVFLGFFLFYTPTTLGVIATSRPLCKTSASCRLQHASRYFLFWIFEFLCRCEGISGYLA